MVAHQEKPVSAPCHVAVDFAVERHVDFHVGGQAVAGNVVHRNFTVRVQHGGDRSDGSFDAVLAGLNAIHEGKCRNAGRSFRARTCQDIPRY